MPKFQYEAMDSQGQEVKAELEALSSEEAISRIRNMGYFPTKVREKGGWRRGKSEQKKTTEPRQRRGTGGKRNTFHCTTG